MLLLLSSVLVSSENAQRRPRFNTSTNKDDEPEIVDIAEAAVIAEPQERAPHPKVDKQLDSKWSFWYQTHYERGRHLNKSDYLREVKKGGTFDTMASFWQHWNEVQERCQHEQCNFHLFKQGVKPVWEDPKNFKGGKCVLVVPRTSHEAMMKQWIQLMIALVMGEFETTEVNGVVLSTRPFGNIFAVWIRNCKDRNAVDAVTRKLHELFGPIQVKFQRHQAAIRKKHGNKPNRKNGSPNESSSDPSSEDEPHERGNVPTNGLRRRSVVNEQTKGLLHQLMTEVTEAPIAPQVQHKETTETAAGTDTETTTEVPPSPGVSGNALHHEAPKTTQIEDDAKKRMKLNAPLKPTANHEHRHIVPKRDSLADINKLNLGLVLVAGVVVSVLSWMFL